MFDWEKLQSQWDQQFLLYFKKKPTIIWNVQKYKNLTSYDIS